MTPRRARRADVIPVASFEVDLAPTELARPHFWRRVGSAFQRTATLTAQLRNAEDRYAGISRLIDTLPLATYVDRPGETRGPAWVSRQIAAITSFTAEEWVADPDLLARVIHADDRERVLTTIAQARRSGEPIDHTYRIHRRDGSVVWVQDSAVLESDGGSRRFRGFIVDISHRREVELELEQQNEQLRQLDHMKDEFIALVSHELRTPLTSIRGYLELMVEDTNLTDEQTRFMDTIDRNAERLQRVVGDLLFVAQVEAGKLNLEDGQVVLNELVTDAVQASRPLADARSITLTAHLGELPAISGDRARLAQVLDNFISNAIKFTPNGGAVAVTTVAQPGEIEVIIADTGMGISAADLPFLFQRFFRTANATSAAIPGTGLGLAIAKAIVTGHGGRIRVESEEGAGTTFRLILPG